MRTKRWRGEKGVSLIEFMISLAIFTLMALSSFYVLTAAKQMSEDSKYRLTALNAGRSALEQIKNTALSNVASMSTSGFIPANLPQGSMTVQTNPSVLSGVTVATVTVTVSWRGARNRPQQLEISTMRSVY